MSFNQQRGETERKPYIVGIGASAGGLEALNNFFDNLPANPELAFVVIQHLSPDHESHMPEILSKHTLMEVCQAEDGMEVQPNNIYLIPPRKQMTIFQQKLFLKERNQDKFHLNLPIDVFFKSLAQEQGEKSIGIIMSGTGSDGTRGIRAIKEKNGVAIVQDETSAKFSAMPNNAISTGVIDYILTPQQMGDKLLSYIQHPYVNDENLEDSSGKDEDVLTKILALLNEKIEVDFTYYKQNTIIRRIERRMAVNQIGKLEDYLALFQESDAEIKTLYQELLIGVTEFFRDKAAFELIKEEILPQIFAVKDPGDEVRVWVAGCSTGEEAYSVAILLREYMRENNLDLEVKVFATDISEESVRQASVGEYPASIAADVSVERLERYFIKQGNSYQIAPKIRKMVVFSAHNIIKDPPFHRMDLITCRNLLIYLKSKMQEKILAIFHFALRKTGFLFLGASESIGKMENYFTTYNSKWKLYQAQENKQIKETISNLNLKTNFQSNRVKARLDRNNKVSNNLNTNYTSGKNKLINRINSRLVTDYLADSAVIDDKNQLIHIVGDINQYLQLPKNRVSLNILEMSPRNLSLVLDVAINKARRRKEEIIYKNIQLESGSMIDLRVSPLFLAEADSSLLVVSFLETEAEGQQQTVEEFDGQESAQRRIEALETELEQTKEDLRATIEELEASNEELQATNEELLASNEELQSTNEELESVNEELITVNAEHQNKIEELTQLNNDMDNLLRSANIGTIFLDDKLYIRKFTPAVRDSINLKERDVGRPLSDISHNIKHDNLLADAKQVLKTLVPIEQKVETNNGDWYLLKILPYRTNQDEIKGVVITFIDITELKDVNQQLKKFEYIIKESPYMIIITDQEGQIKYTNDAFREKTGYSLEEIKNKTPAVLSTEVTDKSKYEKLWSAIKQGNKWQGEFYNQTKEGDIYCERATIFPLINEQEEITNYIKIAESIEQEKAREQELKELKQENIKLKDDQGGGNSD